MKKLILDTLYWVVFFSAVSLLNSTLIDRWVKAEVKAQCPSQEKEERPVNLEPEKGVRGA